MATAQEEIFRRHLQYQYGLQPNDPMPKSLEEVMTLALRPFLVRIKGDEISTSDRADAHTWSIAMPLISPVAIGEAIDSDDSDMDAPVDASAVATPSSMDTNADNEDIIGFDEVVI